MEGRRDSKAQRSQEKLALLVKAPIAVTLEDCLQSFGRLCAVLRTNKPAPDGLAKVADDNFTRLASWGQESGASTNILDHALRFSSELKEQTLELLKDLCLVLEEGQSK